MMNSTPKQCTRCPRLVESRRQIVWGSWHQSEPVSDSQTVMFIGEAPGRQEDSAGKPFVGMTGQEVRHALWRHGLAPHTYFTNVVKCHPPDNDDPAPEEIQCCQEWLEREVGEVWPDLIITAGRFSTRWALGRDDFTMEMVSGILYHAPASHLPCPVLPMVHPAAGFHSQRNMSFVMSAFETAGKVMRGEGPGPIHLPAPTSGQYLLAPEDITVGSYLDNICHTPDTISIDTETGPDGGVWSIQISGQPGTALMIPTSRPDSIARFRAYLMMEDPLCVIHSALYDLPELASINLHPKRIRDTMVMAYLLQDEPLGLKPLAWRHINRKMSSYTETISGARIRKALDYLSFVTTMKWPNPEPYLKWEKGQPRMTTPQGIGPKAKRIIGDVGKGKRLKDGSLVCPRKRWHNIKTEDGRGMAEEILGPMPDGTLADIPIGDAIQYGCADADMTLQVYPHLLSRIQDLDMESLLDVEEGVTRFVDWMHRAGVPADAKYFEALSGELGQEMDRIEREITTTTSHTIQLSSHPQVSDLLYNKLGLRRYLKGVKVSKKSGKTLTGDDILTQIEHHHPCISLIRKYRKLEKLDGTYAKGVPGHIHSTGRVHADFRTTNTDTGRLSCADPNLMAQPKRDKTWAKKMRNGFYAPEGCSILSMDYSQIELRVLAEEAQEESMIHAFLEGLDIHSLTAFEIFILGGSAEGIPIYKLVEMLKEVDKLTQRLPAKTINFGIVYGISAKGLYRNMVVVPGCEHWTEGLAQTYIDRYFERRPGIRSYIQDTISMARRYGRVWDWSGRIRRIPGARLQNEYLRAEAERQACNARIQMGAQSIIKKAMAELLPVYEGFRDQGWDLSPAIQIHDDIVSLVPEDLLPVLIPIQKCIMEEVKPLRAGVRVDVECGKRWGEMEEWVV